ncbi:hypothetical protein COV49_00955 [Candidatus Falkowbacteria bacterium CG11_big_fil_rev_8_21_14_0_20_39_10]|uniref:PilN domain-containing protein n=1 Tax=Candidatus Falkowbacteria bacterium CG11_big_fil_rev_8_21_14_0_20_39_10 TaxID=1974570 RepID=A0A2M6K9Z5_9BACT|nr:MAG: hypothetical protein COV49_00955 [Candidatus Falkowbacteria bacterium CG11_big_fil_rev_8_21_14_0_20_39_10]
MEVDFLKSNKNKEKKKGPETKEIKWSKTEKEPDKSAGQEEGVVKKENGLSRFLNFLKSKLRRRQVISPDLASKIDKKAILSARKEVLKGIKKEKGTTEKTGGWFKLARKKPKPEPEKVKEEIKMKEEVKEDVEVKEEIKAKEEVKAGEIKLKEEAGDNKKQDDKKFENKIKPEKENFFKKIIARLRALATRKKGEEGEKKNNNRELSRIPETNLIRDDLVIFIDWKKNIIMLLIFAGLSFGLVGGTYWGMDKWGKDKEASSREFEEEFKKLDEEIKEAEVEVEEILIFKKKLSLASQLLGQHVYWNNFFEFLEDNILTDVYLTNKGFSGNINGQYGFAMVGKDFGSIEAQVRRFLANKYVTGVSTSQAQISQTADGQIGTVSFNLELDIDKNIFIEYEKE